jgi:two-component system response regulator AtoC
LPFGTWTLILMRIWVGDMTSIATSSIRATASGQTGPGSGQSSSAQMTETSLGRVLLVDDDRSMCEALASGLTKRNFEVVWETDPSKAMGRLVSEDFDVVVSDLRMPQIDGIALCRQITEQRPDLPVVVVTAFGSFDSAIEAIRAGAYDFVTKPFELDSMALTLERASKHRHLREEVRRLRRAVDENRFSGNLIGESASMKRVYDVMSRVAETDATVLVTGESGTGKERVASELHRMSKRANGQFVAINCAALPEALLESELFGHVKGAFTDARVSREGLFVQASGGTLFLDEIGEMPLSLQPKLLRALQERMVRPLGTNAEKPINVRVLAATNKDLDELVEQGRFREDLLYRLKVIEIPVPPLRGRGNDVLLLAQRFTEMFAKQMGKDVLGITTPAAERLLSYSWPGNVRELQNCIERAVVLTQHDRITVEDLPDSIREHKATRVILDTEDPNELPTLDKVEQRYIERVIQAVGGNKRMAARILGIDRKTLYRRLERYGVATTDADME